MAIFDDLQKYRSSNFGLKKPKSWWLNTWMVPISIKILKHGDGFYDEYNFRLTLLLISSYSAYFRIWTSFISFFISSASICLIAPARRRGSAELLHPWIQKRIWIQGPLNIWKEHSNCQINRRGTQKPCSFTDIQYFLHFLL